MKWLLGILAAVVIVPVLAIAVWQQWGRTLPREPLVNCDHIPYLRAQIGDTLLTIPRKYAGRSGFVEGNGTTGDFYGRCQTENDPPVRLTFLTIGSLNPNAPDNKSQNISAFFPYALVRILEGNDPYRAEYNKKMLYIYNGYYNITKNSSIYIEKDAKHYTTPDENILFIKKVSIILWALTQPPQAGLITPDGDFDLSKLRQKENAS